MLISKFLFLLHIFQAYSVQIGSSTESNLLIDLVKVTLSDYFNKSDCLVKSSLLMASEDIQNTENCHGFHEEVLKHKA